MSIDQPRAALHVRIIPFILIVVVTLIAYANSFDVPFTFDDGRNISFNRSVTGFTGDSESLNKVLFENPTPRPLAYLSFGINHLIGGQEVFGYHLVNTLIHALAGIAVYLLALRIGRHPRVLGDGVSVDSRVLFALAAALLFVAHPIQTQAVTYIVQRMASMCALFYVVSLLCYLQGRDGRDKRVWWALALVSWAFALASKQIAVTLPGAILLLEWFLYQDADAKYRKRLLLYGTGAAVAALLIALVFKGGALPRLFTRGYSSRDFTLMERVLTQPRVIWQYLSLVALPLPSRFVLIYDVPLSRSLFSPPTTILAMLTVIGGGVAAFLMAHRCFVASFVVLWVLLHLVVESSIIPLEIAYEHRMYLPLAGICIGVAALIVRRAPNMRIAWTLIGVLTAVLTVSTVVRNGMWSDPVRFWATMAERSPGDPRTHAEEGRARWFAGDPDGAVVAFTRGIELDPTAQASLVRRAEILVSRDDVDGAMRDFNAALALDLPEDRMTTFYDTAYAGRAALLMRTGRFEEAISDLDEALGRTKRTQWLIHRAISKASLGRMRPAIRDFEAAIAVGPDDWRAYSELGWLLATTSTQALQDGPRAVQLASRAMELGGAETPAVLAVLAAGHARAGDFDQAIRWQQAAIDRSEGPVRSRYEGHLGLYRAGSPLTGP